MKALDLDVDGVVDLLVHSEMNGVGSAAVLLQGGGTFADARPVPIPGRMAAVIDLTGDGAAELVTTSPDGFLHASWNDGAASWTDTSRLAGGVLLAAADLDGDRAADLAIDDAIGRESYVLLNRGDTRFEHGPLLPANRLWFSPLSTDLEGDGDLDLIGRLEDGLAALINDGRAGFSGPFSLEWKMPEMSQPPSVAGDFDRDGSPDLAAMSFGDCLVAFAFNRTLPSTSSDRDRDGIPDECRRPPGGQVPGDLNQDGKLDLTDAIGLAGVLFGAGGGGPWPCEGASALDPGPANLRLADSNGDGALDISDPIAVLSYLFLGAVPPAHGTGCIAIAGCPARCAQ